MLEDASPECRQYARQAFLAFHELWPDEAEPLAFQFKSMFMKHKEIMDRLGSLYDGGGSRPRSGVYENAKSAHANTRKTYKQVSQRKVDLDPDAGGTRRTEMATRSQNRLQSKFLSEERDLPDKQKSGPGAAAVSSGFRGIKIANVNQHGRDGYVSKYVKPSASIGLETGASNRTLSATAARPRPHWGSSNPLIERKGKAAHEDDLIELDEKCHDISEIELDPEDNKEATLYPQPYQGYKPASKTTPEQEIFELLERAESDNWTDRINAFEQLASYISNKATSLPNVSMFCKIVNLHFDHLDDPHFKVILVVHKSFGKLIHSFGETLEPYLSEIIPRLLVNLSDTREKINKSAGMLLNLLSQRYGGDKLLKYFVGVLDVKEDEIIITTALEVLSHQLIKSTEDFSKEKSNIKKLVKRIGRIILEFSSTKTITMPALGSLLALRDLETNRTIRAILNLPAKQVELIKSLSESYAPDLASNLNAHTSSDNGKATSGTIYPFVDKKLTLEHNYSGENKSNAVPFFHNYDQVMVDDDNTQTALPSETTTKDINSLGSPESKSFYSNSDIDTIVE